MCEQIQELLKAEEESSLLLKQEADFSVADVESMVSEDDERREALFAKVGHLQSWILSMCLMDIS